MGKMANPTGVKHTAQMQDSLKLSSCEINISGTVYGMRFLWGNTLLKSKKFMSSLQEE